MPCRSAWVPAVLWCLLLPACTLLPKGSVEMDLGMKQRGIASWYGDDFQGWLTANGELYDMHDMTGAHRTLPFGTIVRVTNAENGKHVRVRINDRGPYVNGRIIDLSYAAARRLDLLVTGVAAVQVEVVSRASALFWDEPVPAGPRPLSRLAYAGEGLSGPRLAPSEAKRERSTLMVPSDVYRERRLRRIVDILAAGHRLSEAPTKFLV